MARPTRVNLGWLVLMVGVFGVVGTFREVAGNPALDVDLGPYRFNVWLLLASLSLFAWLLLSYLRVKGDRDELLRRPPPDFRVHLGLARTDVKAMGNPSLTANLDSLEAVSFYLSVRVFAVNRGANSIALTIGLDATWKNGKRAFCAPVSASSLLRRWDYSEAGAESPPLAWPLNLGPHASEAGSLGFMVLPEGANTGLDDLGDVTATITEHISGEVRAIEPPGEWDTRP